MLDLRKVNANIYCEHDDDCYSEDKCFNGLCAIKLNETEYMMKTEMPQKIWRKFSKLDFDKLILDKSTSKDAVCYYNNGTLFNINDDAPMTCITKSHAIKICDIMGGRLPTKQEYENINKGTKRRDCENTVMAGAPKKKIKDYINSFGCGTASFHNICDKTSGNSEQGYCDLIGNVRELTQDQLAYGGSFTTGLEYLHTEYNIAPSVDTGFRCIFKDK